MQEEKMMIPSNDIDKVTLEFLMNKNQYKKYISKTDPSKHIQNEKYMNKIYNYKNKILELTNELLNNPERQITLDVNESFDIYVKSLIRYFETKEMEKSDNDTLFEKIDEDNIETIREPEMEYDSIPEPNKKSYWGLQRVVKKTQIQIPLHKKEEY